MCNSLSSFWRHIISCSFAPYVLSHFYVHEMQSEFSQKSLVEQFGNSSLAKIWKIASLVVTTQIDEDIPNEHIKHIYNGNGDIICQY